MSQKLAGFMQQLKDAIAAEENARTAARHGSFSGAILCEAPVADLTRVRIWSDGTFEAKSGLGWSIRDELISFEYDIDSMRRKSVTGRSAAAVTTGGISLLAHNNRGVVYVTIHGRKTGVKTFTTRNPTGQILDGIRSLKAAADSAISRSGSVVQDRASKTNFAEDLQKLADLRGSGALTDEEYASAKARLLS